ncbi:hypothetical protein Pan258_54470 [Symmachiella dynata]|nr:hypothetical protein Pan258_54470 [Symmachiella dynata]
MNTDQTRMLAPPFVNSQTDRLRSLSAILLIEIAQYALRRRPLRQRQ